jgi:hypothetical protein
MVTGFVGRGADFRRICLRQQAASTERLYSLVADPLVAGAADDRGEGPPRATP